MVVSMERWAGKVAVVTGASSGIGAAISDQLVRNGLKVVGIARRTERIDEQSKKLHGTNGKLYALKADLTNENEIIDAFKWIKQHLGGIHILINNAGVFCTNTLIDGDIEKWRQTFDVNVIALCICTREAINNMKHFHIDNGHVVHINSIAGYKVPNFPNLNVYAASKYAVTALTETLRTELVNQQSKIRITSINPGFVETEMTTLNPNRTAEQKAVMEQFPRLQAEDIADAVIYALSTPEHVQILEMTVKPVGEARLREALRISHETNDEGRLQDSGKPYNRPQSSDQLYEINFPE